LIFSNDNNRVTLREETLDICDYRQFIYKVIVKVERQIQELFCKELAPDLPPLESLTENYMDTTAGWSFLNSEANPRLEQLSRIFLEQVKHQFAQKGDSSNWDECKLKEFHEKHTKFLRTLLVML
jgi:hypothetical protein